MRATQRQIGATPLAQQWTSLPARAYNWLDTHNISTQAAIAAAEQASPLMADKPQPSSLFSPIDVSTHSSSNVGDRSQDDTLKEVLSQLLSAQDRQNELLEELIEQMGAAQRQRSAELAQWKQANPRLARRCREAAELLGRVQSSFLESVTEEVLDSAEDMVDGEFVLNEFVDRFGPRLAHLNGVLQVVSQLSANGND